MLSQAQVAELKKQLSDQIKHLPESQRIQAQEEINDLSEEALESMIEEQKSKGPRKTPLRQIIDKELQAYVIADTKQGLAALDIRPISKGHTIIIPKIKANETSQIPSTLFSLAKKIASKVKLKLEAKGAEIHTEAKFGEYIINIIPVYEKAVTVSSPRYEASQAELTEVQNSLAMRTRTVKKKVNQKPSSQTPQVQIKSLPILKRRRA